jgi:hypothetical protein
MIFEMSSVICLVDCCLFYDVLQPLHSWHDECGAVDTSEQIRDLLSSQCSWYGYPVLFLSINTGNVKHRDQKPETQTWPLRVQFVNQKGVPKVPKETSLERFLTTVVKIDFLNLNYNIKTASS